MVRLRGGERGGATSGVGAERDKGWGAERWMKGWGWEVRQGGGVTSGVGLRDWKTGGAKEVW